MLTLIRTTRLSDIIDKHQRLAAELLELRTTLLPRLQRVESELIFTKLERFFRELHTAIELAARQGIDAAGAIEKGLSAIVAPLPHGKAGGLARASTAWRYFDGTFMPASQKAVAYRGEYERFAAGGRARALGAQRARDGRFLPR